MSCRNQPAAELSGDPEEHLKFIRFGRQLEKGNGRERPLDEDRIVRRDPDVAPRPEENVHQGRVAVADLFPVLEGDLVGLDVDAFAHADVRAERGGSRGVVPAPAQIRLQDETDVFGVSASFLEETDRRLRDGGVLHVDPHEVAVTARGFHDSIEFAATMLSIDLQTERGQLHRDVRVKVSGRDAVEGAHVLVDRAPGLLALLDVLAENVERGHAPLVVQRADRFEGFLERFSGDVPMRDPPHDRTRHERHRRDDQAIDEVHPESDGFSSRSKSSREARAKHHTSTCPAPAATRARAHSRAVHADVATSSIRRTVSGDGPSARNAPSTFDRRCSRASALCRDVSRILRRRRGENERPSSFATASARSSAGWYPRRRTARAVAGTAVTSDAESVSSRASLPTTTCASRGPR